MKKFASILLLILALVSIASCTGESRLQTDLAVSNRSLPNDLGNGMTVEKIKYDNGIVTVTYTLSPYYFDAEDIHDVLGAVTEQFKASHDKEITDMIELFREGGADLRIIVRLGQNGPSDYAIIRNYEM